jgi:membrane peptidoglycan carboxypeptidase
VTPYLVGNIFRNKKRLYEAKPKKEPAFDPKVVADVTFALQGVLKPDGTASKAVLAGARPAAGKTGTTSDNKDAWFVGYTPQLSTAVWVGFDPPRELKDIQIAGERVTQLTGGQGPARVWKSFMDAALAGQPSVAFPPPANIGGSKAPSASVSSSASVSPSSVSPSVSPSSSTAPPSSASSAPPPSVPPSSQPAPGSSPPPASSPPPSSEPPPPAPSSSPPPASSAAAQPAPGG